MGSSLYDKADI
jgi:ATP-dependent DNA helicase 2 subunit 2